MGIMNWLEGWLNPDYGKSRQQIIDEWPIEQQIAFYERTHIFTNIGNTDVYTSMKKGPEQYKRDMAKAAELRKKAGYT